MTTTTPPAPLNLDVLPGLSSNAPLMNKLLGAFRAQLIGDLQRLVDAVKANDPAAVASVAHALKGAAGTLSAQGVRTQAATLEAAGKAGALDGAEATIAALKTECDVCLAYIATVTKSEK